MKRRTFFALFAALALVGAACGGDTPVAVGGEPEPVVDERIELDDIELRNDCWGCFAG